jgi:undecaprenyl-phosphate 4-deoxy-4-formamido-L-arabinose transferase
MPSTSSPMLSVIIPVFNEELCLEELCRRLYKVLRGMGNRFEVLFVDDGSSDGSLKLLLELKKKYRPMKVLHFARNYGQHPAVTAGMAESKGDVIVTLDADLQNPPEEIPKLVQALQKGYDIAAGWREHREDSLLRTIPSRIVNRLISRVTTVKLHDYGCMLRAYSRVLVDRFLKCEERATYITALMNVLSRNVIEVPVRHEPRTQGKSKYRFFSLFNFVLNIMIGFSDYPIRMVSYSGFLFSLVGVGLGFYLVIYRFFYGASGGSGLTSFVAVLLVLFGIEFVLLGLMGEYLARIYSEVQKRPRYVVDKVYAS